MNQRQKITLVATAAIVLLMVLFPPYRIVLRGVVQRTRYGFLLLIPEIPSTPNFAGAHGEIDVTTLVVQVLGVLIIAGLVCFALRDATASNDWTRHED